MSFRPASGHDRAPSHWLSWSAAGLLTALGWLMAVSSVADKGTVYDEMSHLTAGASYWRYDDYRLHPENGILTQRLLGLPAILQGAAFPAPEGPEWRRSDVWALGDRFFYRLGNDPARLLGSGRAVTALLGAGLSLLIWRWSRRLFGAAGGMLSLTLAVFSPTLLAHGRLATSDLCASLAFLAALASLSALLQRVTPVRLGLSTLTSGVLVLAKFSGLLILPMAAALGILRWVRKEPLPLAWGQSERVVEGRGRLAVTLAMLALIHAAVAVLLIWAAYGFRYSAFGEHTTINDAFYFDGWSHVEAVDAPAVDTVLFARERQLLPEAFLYGLGVQLVHLREHSAFLDGSYSGTGFASFFPRAFVYKTPLALWPLLALALLAAARRWRAGAAVSASLLCTAPLFVLILVGWAVALGSNLNIGHRHLLSTYPALFILAGGSAAWLGRATVGRGAAAALALAGFALSSWSIRPHYLSFFNPLAGGPANGYRHLVDSSLDWGQDLPGLKRWLDEHGPGTAGEEPVYLSYFGKGDPDFYGIRARHLPFSPPTYRRVEIFPLVGGTYCISATMLQQVYLDIKIPWTAALEERYGRALTEVQRYDRASLQDGLEELFAQQPESYWNGVLANYDLLRFARLCAYLRGREPDDQIGYSILIYHLTDDDVRAALSGDAPIG